MVVLVSSETKTEGDCISFSSFGGFFYQPIDFYRAYAEQGNI